ncbi:HutD/Ves family protein [Ramlibacter humi]|uniref:HutD family protein n=1 Tax=Ramlibacter humi TaxID=2530451 RepID=A0A4Z0BIF9_9BURK|nr:HutD family protein [Ramlibacter humi]TFY98189.1 HutD family protein [Ramlibacter humi]
MSWNFVPLDSVTPQPWKNGGGTTRELLAWPQAEGWKVRLSVADVTAAGPFSRFEGIERWFSVLEGEGVVLKVAGGRHWLRADSEPFRFDGGLATDCELSNGSTRDLNLMAPPGRSRMRRLQPAEQMFKMRGPGLLAIYAHSQPSRVILDWVNVDVPAYTLAWRWCGEAMSGIARGADALLMEAQA